MPKSSKKPLSDRAFKKAFDRFLESHFVLRSLKQTEQLLSKDFTLFGTAIHEVAFSRQHSKQFFIGDYQEVKQPLEVFRKSIKLQKISDKTALVASVFNLSGVADGLEFELDNIRLTALLCDEDGEIRIRHLHFSFPQSVAGTPESYPIRLLQSLLRETEEKYRLIFDNAPIGIMQFDNKGIIKECNQKILQIMGTSAKKVIGFNMLKMADKNAVAAIETVLKGHKGYYEGYYRSVTGGKTTPLKVRITPIFASDASVMGGLGIYEDIGESRLAESKLHYQFQFEKILATISSSFVNAKSEELDGIMVNALGLTARFFNAERSYIFQINADGLTATNTHEWEEPGIPPIKHKYEKLPLAELGDMGGFIERLRDHIQIPDVKNFPPELEAARHILTAGVVKSVLIMPLVINNQLAGCFGFDCVNEARSWSYEEINLLKVVAEIFSNAIAQQRSEAKIKESEKKYRLLADNVSDIIWVADLTEKRFTYVSPASEKVLGMTPEEIMAEPLDGRLFGDTADFFKAVGPQRHAQASEGTCITFTDELMQCHKNGQKIPTEVTTTYLKDSATGHFLIIGVTRDISLRKKAEEQRAMLELQESKNRRLDQIGAMAGKIVHDLNNRLQVIKGNLELLKLGAQDPKLVIKRLEDALRATDKASAITSAMLSYLSNEESKTQTREKTKSVKTQVTELNSTENQPPILEFFTEKMAGKKVLLVENDQMIRIITLGILKHFNFSVLETDNFNETPDIFKAEKDEIGLIICDHSSIDKKNDKKIKAFFATARVPVIITSGYDQSFAMKAPLDKKSMFFLKKPFGARDLLAAMKNALEPERIQKAVKAKSAAGKKVKNKPGLSQSKRK